MENNIKTPIDLCKKTIWDLFNENEEKLKQITYISPTILDYDDTIYNLPNQSSFLHVQWNKTFLVSKGKIGKIKVTIVANFIVIDAKECTLIYNDKSNKNATKYYVATLRNCNNKTEKDINIMNNSKSDFKQFQSDINSACNDFTINMKDPVFKTFVSEYISPLVTDKLTVYTNAGVTPNGNFLYKNALATPKEIIWADNDGYIKTGEHSYLKLDKSTHNLPKLAKSSKTGQEIALELITNIKECWEKDIAIPMLTLGHMVMALYYNEFATRIGAPTLILYGETGTGKSTLVTVGIAIFGLPKEAMTSGGSSSKSSEYFCSKYNCLNVCIDDVKSTTLMGENFIALIKGVYNGIPRTKMGSYGKEVIYVQTCSPLAYSTNETLPDLKEVINRMNVIEIFGNVFNADKFNYHEFNKTNLEELSLILPELLKYPKEKVISIYEKVFNELQKQVEDTQKRIINNIAYAYTGALLLKYISGVEIENLHDKVIEFAKKQVEKYDEIQTPVDKFLTELLILHRL